MHYHPEYMKVVQSFEDINCFKYAAYRTALKIQRIQKITKLHCVDMNDISAIFENDFCKNSPVTTWEEVEPFLINLFNVANQRFHFTEDFSSLAEIVFSLLHSTFCGTSGNSLMSYQVKLTLAVFCGAKLVEKYKYITQLFTVDDFISKEKLYLMLSCFAKICENLEETSSFGLGLVPSAVLNCLHFCSESSKIPVTGIREWFFREPQTLVWLSTHHRLSASQNVEHDVKCSVCKCCPLVGLRYTCLCCVSYNLCQRCFLLGFANKNHKIQHKMKEFCRKASGWFEMKIMLAVVQNKMCLSQKYKKSYLPYDGSDPNIKSSLLNREMCFDESQLAIDTPFHMSAFLQELSSAIEKLEAENKQIYTEMKKLGVDSFENEVHKNSVPDGMLIIKQEVLERHGAHLETQLLRLHNLLLSLKTFMEIQLEKQICVSPGLKIPINVNSYYESTPIIVAAGQPNVQPNLGTFLKYQCNVSELENMHGDSSNNCQNVLLYSVGDIDISECGKNTKCEISNESSPKRISEDNVLTPINDGFTDGNKVSSELELVNHKEISSISSFQPNVLEEKSDLNEISKNLSNALKVLTPRVNSAFSFSKICLPEMKIADSNLASGVDHELQLVLDRLESFFPKMTGTDFSSEKNQLLYALSEMEVALKKISTSSLPNTSFNRNGIVLE